MPVPFLLQPRGDLSHFLRDVRNGLPTGLVEATIKRSLKQRQQVSLCPRSPTLRIMQGQGWGWRRTTGPALPRAGGQDCERSGTGRDARVSVRAQPSLPPFLRLWCKPEDPQQFFSCFSEINSVFLPLIIIQTPPAPPSFSSH